MRGGWKYAVMVRRKEDEKIVRIKCYRAHEIEAALDMRDIYRELPWVANAWLIEYA